MWGLLGLVIGLVKRGVWKGNGRDTIVSECLSGLYIDVAVADTECRVRLCEGVAGWELGEDGAEKAGCGDEVGEHCGILSSSAGGDD